MKLEITTPFDKASATQPGAPAQDETPAADHVELGHRHPVRKTLQRYCSLTLIIAVTIGGMMIFLGLRPIGKGLILGAVFSVINFILMATALPTRIGLGRSKSFFFSVGSIYLRFALMAVPLVISLKQDLFAVSTVAVGLFMVQLTILGDHLWDRLRNPAKAKC